MRFKDAVKFSFGDLRKRKGRTILTSLGIAVGSMLIITMVSMGTSVKGYLMDQLKQINNAKTVTVYNTRNIDTSELSDMKMMEEVNEFYEQNFKKLDDETIAKLSSIDGVTSVQAYIDTSVDTIKLEGKENSGRFNVTGINTEYSVFSEGDIEMARAKKNNKDLQPVKAGRTLKETDRNSALIGETYLKKLDIKNYEEVIGKELTVIQESTSNMLVKVKPMEMKLTVIGVVDESFSEGISIVVSNEVAGKLKGRESFTNDYVNAKGYDYVKLHAQNAEDVKGITEKLKSMDYGYVSFEDIAKRISDIFMQAEMVLSILGIIVLFVAAIGIVNTMIMSVFERTKSIGIMKAVGASCVNINTIFVTEAGVIGFLGGIMGIILGAGINKIIQVLLSNFMTGIGLTETISFGTPAWLTLGTLIFSLTIAILAGLYPANRASKMDPIEALAAR